MQPVTTVDASNEPTFAKTWNDFGLLPALAEAIRVHKGPDKHLAQVSTIQREVLKSSKDASIFGIAPTGSGKAIAMLAPALDELLKGTAKSALVLAITNPLLDQHVDTLAPIVNNPKLPKKVYSTKANPKSSSRILEAAKKGPVIIFSTPHQILEMSKKSSQFREFVARLDYVILDEVDGIVADHVFGRQVTEVTKASPKARLIAVTATFTDEALKKVREISHRPVVHIIAGKVHKAVIDHKAYVVAPGDLMTVLSMVLNNQACRPIQSGGSDSEPGATETPPQKVIVFCSTNAFIDFAFQYCVAAGVKNCSLMNAKMSEGARRAAAREFQECKECILFGSDVTARGMDFEGVTLIVQVGYSVPDTYMQRAGRTGRGLVKTGKCIVLLTKNETKALEQIKNARKLEIPQTVCVPVQKLRVQVPAKVVDKAYTAYLGAYRGFSRSLGWTRPKGADMVEEIDAIVTGAGYRVPEVSEKLKRKLGIA
jgi:ATP-dependent RNA helicase MSS116, mitochondrial